MTASSPAADRRAGPLPPSLAPLTVPIAWLYGAAIALRNARYERGCGVTRLALPTISVGNVVAGGSGKSPVVRWLAELLREMGRRPLIALRGYGERAGVGSDEAMEHRQRLPEVPVVVGADRVAAVATALDRGVRADCVLLDDGFQHRRVARDLDLVLVDSRRPLLDGRLLPAGWLREPASSLARADGVIVTHAAAVNPQLSDAITQRHGRAPLAWVDHRWHGLDAWITCDGARPRLECTHPTSWLRGRQVVAMLGLADPSSVVAMAEGNGARVDLLRGRDHQRYDGAWLDRLRRRLDETKADAAFVTGKDWVKIAPLLDSARRGLGRPILVPRLTIEPSAGADAVRTALRNAVGPPSVETGPRADSGTASTQPQTYSGDR